MGEGSGDSPIYAHRVYLTTSLDGRTFTPIGQPVAAPGISELIAFPDDSVGL
ncbi:MAG TPA: hypothetical protein G4O04_04490 [Anaerolineae bacterium]|nr:hypothetical protein [Anaerolineae bacterium]